MGHFFESGDTVRDASANNPWLRDYEAAIKRIAPLDGMAVQIIEVSTRH